MKYNASLYTPQNPLSRGDFVAQHQHRHIENLVTKYLFPSFRRACPGNGPGGTERKYKNVKYFSLKGNHQTKINGAEMKNLVAMTPNPLKGGRKHRIIKIMTGKINHFVSSEVPNSTFRGPGGQIDNAKQTNTITSKVSGKKQYSSTYQNSTNKLCYIANHQITNLSITL